MAASGDNPDKDYKDVPGRIITFNKGKGKFSSKPDRWSNVRACTTCKEVEAS